MKEKIEILDVLSSVLLSYKNVVATILEFYLGADYFSGMSPIEIAETYLGDSEEPNNPRVVCYKSIDNFTSVFEPYYGILFPINLEDEETIIVNIQVGHLKTDFSEDDLVERIISYPEPPLSHETCLLLATGIESVKNIWIDLDSDYIKSTTYFDTLEVECSSPDNVDFKHIDFYTTCLNKSSDNEFYAFLESYLNGNMLEAYTFLDTIDTLAVTEEQISVMLLYESIKEESDENLS